MIDPKTIELLNGGPVPEFVLKFYRELLKSPPDRKIVFSMPRHAGKTAVSRLLREHGPTVGRVK